MFASIKSIFLKREREIKTPPYHPDRIKSPDKPINSMMRYREIRNAKYIKIFVCALKMLVDLFLFKIYNINIKFVIFITNFFINIRVVIYIILNTFGIILRSINILMMYRRV